MTLPIYVSAVVCSSLTLILIIFDYSQKYNTDFFQRRLMISLLVMIFVSIFLDFLRIIFTEPYKDLINRNVLYIITSSCLVSSVCGFFIGTVFFDYFINGSKNRTKKYIIVVCAFMALYAISVILNIPFGYYFSISPSNIYAPGNLQIILILINYLPALIIIINILLALKKLPRLQAVSMFFFLFVSLSGLTADNILETTFFIWPCLAAAILCLYFFIIKSDSRIDSLTGIGNRYSFNEFINKLSRQTTREDYAVAIIDLDRFKEINDTLGHLEGDNALRDIALIIKSCTRKTDLAARFGGDEFVLTARAENINIQQIIDRINEAINSQNQRKIRPYQLYMSYGYDIYTTGAGQSIQSFIAHVDELMFKHKESRRKINTTAITAKLENEDKNA